MQDTYFFRIRHMYVLLDISCVILNTDQTTEEDTTMKRTTTAPRICTYTSAQMRRYHLNRFLNGILALLTGLGIFVTVAFLLFL